MRFVQTIYSASGRRCRKRVPVEDLGGRERGREGGGRGKEGDIWGGGGSELRERGREREWGGGGRVPVSYVIWCDGTMS